MSEPKCSIAACDKPHLALGFCRTHYQRFKKYGDPTKRVKAEYHLKCIVKGCGKPNKSKGLCRLHYFRARRNGDPITVHKTGPKPKAVTKKGYRYIWVDGKCREVHRVKMEKKLGRKLRTSEHVHHKNENRGDNSDDNLQVLDASDHAKLHGKKNRFWERSPTNLRSQQPEKPSTD